LNNYRINKQGSEDMSLPIAALVIIFSGALGGFFNAIIVDGGFVQGGKRAIRGGTVLSLGFFSNILCGAFAAFVSWGLYGPLSTVDIAQANTVGLTLATLCGSALTGFSGASWLTTQADKNAWKTNAIEATQAQPSPEAAAKMASQTPEEANMTVQTLRRLPN
jgi:hypothetical protein